MRDEEDPDSKQADVVKVFEKIRNVRKQKIGEVIMAHDEDLVIEQTLILDAKDVESSEKLIILEQII